MLRAIKPDRTISIALLLLSFFISSLALADGITLDSIEVNDDKIDSTSDVYVQEDATITIKFSRVDDEYDEWDLRLESISGLELKSGDFDSDDEEVSFTTAEVRQRVENDGDSFYSNDNLYQYDVILRVVSSKKKKLIVPAIAPKRTKLIEDGDYDDYYDYDDDPDYEEEDEGSLTQTITVHVDMDPPADVELSDSITPGEGSLTVFWTEVEYSVEGNLESGDMHYTFCVRKVDDLPADERPVSLRPFIVFENGDGEVIIDGDMDAEAPYVPEEDGDEVVEDGDTITEDGDQEVEKPVEDGDEELEGDRTISEIDGDDDEDEESTIAQEITDCIDPVPEGTTGDSYKIEGLENGLVYEIRARAIDEAGNKSLNWSEPIYGTPRSVDDFWESYKKAGGSEDGGFCFIATAAYGHYDHKHVVRLRAFRDGVLAQNAVGRAFINFYYKTSPPLAKIVKENPVMAWLVRVYLSPIIAWLMLLFEVSMTGKFFMLGGVLTVAAIGSALPARRARR